MLMRNLGRTPLQVAALCLGGNVFGWTCDEPTSFAVLDAYMGGGGNFIDTADTYSTWVAGHVGGESEAIIGNWMAQRKNRERVVIATKVGSRMANDPNAQGLSRRHIMQSCENSLRRLQTDYIDLYQAHIDDQNAPLEETLQAFNDLVQQGKVRYIGASNYSAARLAEALNISQQRGFARYESLQPPYSLANREAYEKELEPLCRKQGIGVITYSSLASGFLTGKYGQDKDMPPTPRAQNIQRRYMNEQGFKLLTELEHIVKTQKATMAQVALAWIIARPGITAPIASATSVEQTHELLGALDLHLDDATMAALGRASAWR
ncbi:MAG TPA: aldo/keto reductase [Ktedonobacteraceae bacterium]|nr:aldo/keto reductase [Ktedonobacteraceae bacterium]